MGSLDKWINNKSLNPFNELFEADSPFDKFFNDMLSLRRRNQLDKINFSPTCDISEEDDSYVFKFDLPGVDKDKVDVEVENDRLTITAERSDEKEEKSKKKYLSEIYYGSYSRSFTLPGPVNESDVNASFKDGVLTVTVPKTKNTKSKKIPIQ